MADAKTQDVPSGEQKFYNDSLGAIATREKEFETGWWKAAHDAEQIYTIDKESKESAVPYNILYSNTEVLLPSLYSATPKPDIRSRYKEQNIKPIPDVVQRFLTCASDPQSPGGDCFDGAMQDAVLSSLVPGMGYVRIRYVEEDAFPLRYESGHFKTLIWGKGSRWAKVPWVAFKVTMKREQMLSQFGKTAEEGQENYKPSSESEEDKDNCTVYEFWDKKTKKVYFLCEEWKEKLLKAADDPLGLENFFPTPGLLMMTVRNGKYLPIPLYNYYKEQAEELNRVSTRLKYVLQAIRVRGAYNGLLGDDLKNLLGTEDGMENKLFPAAEAALLAQSGGFDKHIWLLPIENLITVAKELYTAREQIKQVIYELTGISDIIRGSSAPSETATAQDLKNKWGTVRLRRMQTVVANYARDLFRMSVDCGSDRIPPEKWAAITQLDQIPSAAMKQAAQQRLQQMQQQAAMMPPPVPQPPIPGQPLQPPPGPPPPDPKLLAAAQSPSWEEILAKIKSDQNRTFIINIQTSSTVDLDTAQDKAEVNEFMAAMGQLLPGLGGFLTLGPTGIAAAKEILKQVCLRYKFGIEIADQIDAIQPPPPAAPAGPSPEEKAAIQADAQATQVQAGVKIQKAQSDQRVAQAQEQAALAKISHDAKMLDLEIQASNLRLQEQREKLAHDKEMRDIKVAQAKAKPAPTLNAS